MSFSYFIFFIFINFFKINLNNFTCQKYNPILRYLINPKISIIIPVYNSEKYLKDCLDSLLNQTFNEIEIICVDDGSTDNSLSILKQYAKYDNRIIILQQKNQGAGVARNNGMKIAKGEYLLFLDSDDFFKKEMIQILVNNAEKKKADIVIFKFLKYNQTTGTSTHIKMSVKKKGWPNGLFNYSSNPNKIFVSFYPCAWNKLFRHSFIKENNLFFQDNKRTNDLFFTSTSLAVAKRIYYLNKELLYYRIGLTNNSQSTNELYPWDFYKALLGVKNFLEQKNLFSQLKEGYNALAKNIIIYNLNHNKKNIYLYEELKREKFKNLGIEPIPSFLISKNFDEKYLDNLYFKHINLMKDKNEINIVRKTQMFFIPKVSVIISVYNVENFIMDCLDSILNQTLKEIEIICVNDGSTDNSLSIIKEYTKNESRIQIINQNNRGLSMSRNNGVKYSNGQFLYFINGEDYLEKNALSNLYYKAVNNNLDIIYFDAELIYNKNNTKNPQKLEKIFNFYNKLYHRKTNYSEIITGKEMFYQMNKNNEFISFTCLQFIKKDFYIKANLSFYPGILDEENLFTFTSMLLANRTIYIKKFYYKKRIYNNLIITRNIQNLYGFFITYLEILKFLKNKEFDNKIKYAISEKIKKYIIIIIDIFNIIPKREKMIFFKKLNSNQKIKFNNIIKNRHKRKKRKKKKMIKNFKLKFFLFYFILLILNN